MLESLIAEKDVLTKLLLLKDEVTKSLDGVAYRYPDLPGRRQSLFQEGLHGLAKPGLQNRKGLAWLLHDLANIELQAMEMCLRTLHDFPNADIEFLEEIIELLFEEAEHLKLCLDGLAELGFKFGDFPIHLKLWSATRRSDSLVDRVFIVHVYLEASGLDSGEHILSRLKGLRKNPESEMATRIVQKIVNDEIRHVQFGTKWYQRFSGTEMKDLNSRLQHLKDQLPKRGTALNLDSRRKAGFTEEQTKIMIEFQKGQF